MDVERSNDIFLSIVGFPPWNTSFNKIVSDSGVTMALRIELMFEEWSTMKIEIVNLLAPFGQNYFEGW
jgi:hypothetical protein